MKRIRSQVEYDVIKAYFDCIITGEIEKMKRDSLALYAENLRDVKNLYRTGSVPQFEFLQAQVQAKALEPQVLEARERPQPCRGHVQLPPGIRRPGKHVPDGAVMKAEFRAPGGDPDAAVARMKAAALKHRPEVVQIELKRDAAHHRREAGASIYLWPTFSVAGYYGKTKYMPNEVDVNLPPAANPARLLADLRHATSGRPPGRSAWPPRTGGAP